MKKAIIAILFVAFAATGCAVNPPEPIRVAATTTTAAATTTITPTATTEELFVMYVRSKVDRVSGASDETIVSLGKSVCEALEAGNSLDEVGSMFLSEGWSPEDAGAIIGASQGAFCGATA